MLAATVKARPGGLARQPQALPRALGRGPALPAARPAALGARRAAAARRAPLARAGSGGDAAAALPASAELQAPVYFPPFLRSFVLGVCVGALLEGGHVAAELRAGTFPGVGAFRPSFLADHVAALCAWAALYAVEAAAVAAALRACGGAGGGAGGRCALPQRTLPQRLFPARREAFDRAYTALEGAARARAAVVAALSAAAAGGGAATAESGAGGEPRAAAPPPRGARAPAGAVNAAVAAPRPKTRGPAGGPGPGPDGGGGGASPGAGKRAKELRDREGYLKNFWYCACLSSDLRDGEPRRATVCGRDFVLWRDPGTGALAALDDACPHRGAPLSAGWVSAAGAGAGSGSDRSSAAAPANPENCAPASTINCPYHGWALDARGVLRDVPAAAAKGEWPRRPLAGAYDAREAGGFVWLFLGPASLPEAERPPIPYAPQLDDPGWRPVYAELEFDAGHFGVFENAIDMAHIHYLHEFGNGERPEIRDMRLVAQDAFGVSVAFDVCNRPVNAFWALFRVPAVHVTAQALLPSTSVVEFTLGGGLSFITFVTTTPLSATRCVNRFALVRRLGADPTGLFNAGVWDGAARRAMMKIQREDKAMVERLRYDALPAEFSVRADLPQVAFRRLRQQWVDLGYGLPTEAEAPPHATKARHGV